MPGLLAPSRPASRWFAALSGAALLGACSRASDAPAPHEVASGEASGHTHRLAAASAFGLAAAPDGALLAWADPEGHLLFQHLNAAGALAPRAQLLDGLREPRDLSLVAAAGGALALAWSEPGDGASDGSGHAAWLDPDGGARRFPLGPAFRVAPAERGGLALAASGADALLFLRGASVACNDGTSAECSAFQFFRVSPDGAVATGLPLVVPAACDVQAAQLVSRAGREPASAGRERFDYAVCSSARAQPALTVFSIQPSPAYAMAEEAFAGCAALGAGRFGGEVGFVASCAGQRRMAIVPGGGESLVLRDLDARGLVCRAGSPLLRLGNGWLKLDEPLAALELLLDDALAPAGARAVWTGAALVVARPDPSGELRLARHACQGGMLVELQGGADAGF